MAKAKAKEAKGGEGGEGGEGREKGEEKKKRILKMIITDSCQAKGYCGEMKVIAIYHPNLGNFFMKST